MTLNRITHEIIGAAIEVHSQLGPGLLESAYHDCLHYELMQRGIKAEREKELPLIYRDVKMESIFRVDLMVEDKEIVELKAVKEIEDIHIAQVLTYLKLSNKEVGLLMNFNVTKMADGIKRLMNKYYVG
jgi:GxxExxY protein